MNKKRAKELINAIINNISVGQSNVTVIKYLLFVGFTKKELIKDFNFTKEDVLDAAEGMDEYEDTLIFV